MDRGPDSEDTAWRTLQITALFCSVAAALYTIAQVEPSSRVGYFFSIGPVIAAIIWLERDAARTGVGSVHDLGFFLWFAWPLVVPWYSWKTRGWSGWKLCLSLFALVLSPYLSGIVVGLLMYGAGYIVR